MVLGMLKELGGYEVLGGWRKVNTEELRNLYYSQ
jgi:hypothetical protein